MRRIRPHRAAAACVVALALGFVLSACGEDEDEIGVKEPAREGLAIDVGGIDYNVFITRELNLEITPDKAYYDGPAAPEGNALYGVFLQACNREGGRIPATEEFVVEDNQGNEFEPKELPEDNEFAYHAKTLGQGDCIPEAGSVAEQGVTAGSLLLFEFPLENTENRPLELVISAPDSETRERVTKRVELDL